MAKELRIPEHLKPWIEARRRFHLSHMHIHMARELGMNPKKFGKLANHRQEPWKAPLPIFIESIYFKRFGEEKPDRIMSIREVASAQQAKRAARKLAKQARRAARDAALLPAAQVDGQSATECANGAESTGATRYLIQFPDHASASTSLSEDV